MADYREAPLATRPKTLDPAEYFNLSQDYRRTEQDRAAMRARLKRQFQVQLNNPLRKELIEDPALTRWVYARSHIYPHFKPTSRTSLIGALVTVVPLLFWFGVLKTDRDKREERIAAGTQNRGYPFSY